MTFDPLARTSQPVVRESLEYDIEQERQRIAVTEEYLQHSDAFARLVQFPEWQDYVAVLENRIADLKEQCVATDPFKEPQRDWALKVEIRTLQGPLNAAVALRASSRDRASIRQRLKQWGGELRDKINLLLTLPDPTSNS